MVTDNKTYAYEGGSPSFVAVTTTGGAQTLGKYSVDSLVSEYPPAHNATYVKATSVHFDFDEYKPFLATDPAKSLTGSAEAYVAWRAGAATEQRFHIDLGEAIVVTSIYYENFHHSGTLTTNGIKTFTFWGSNNSAAFAELTYGTDTNWTQLTCSQATFDAHVAADEADPKYITVTNSTGYRYYAFKIADGYGGDGTFGVRRLTVQSSVGTSVAGSVVLMSDADVDKTVTLKAGDNEADMTLTLPTAVPAGNNYLLNSSTAGALGYTDPATFAAALGGDDNYVTDAEKAALHTNTYSSIIDVVQVGNLGIATNDTDSFVFSFVPSKIVIKYSACVPTVTTLVPGQTQGTCVVTITDTDTCTYNLNWHWMGGSTLGGGGVNRSTTYAFAMEGGDGASYITGTIAWVTSTKTLTVTWTNTECDTTGPIFEALAVAFK